MPPGKDGSHGSVTLGTEATRVQAARPPFSTESVCHHLQEGLPDPICRKLSKPLEGPGPCPPDLSSVLSQAWPSLTKRTNERLGLGWCPSLGHMCQRAESSPQRSLEVSLNECRAGGAVSWRLSSPGPELEQPPLLSLGCPHNRFGLNCEQVCSCRNGGQCHPANGSCSCGLGWTGRHCELGECPAAGGPRAVGWRVAPGDLNGASAQGAVPRAPARAQQGPTPPLSPACPTGRFGAACGMQCACRNNGTCEPATGTCQCGPGFYGQACEHCESWAGTLPRHLLLPLGGLG